MMIRVSKVITARTNACVLAKNSILVRFGIPLGVHFDVDDARSVEEQVTVKPRESSSTA